MPRKLRIEYPGAMYHVMSRETTLSLKAIAKRVQLGSSKAANRLVHGYMRSAGAGGEAQEQLKIRTRQAREMTQAMG